MPSEGTDTNLGYIYTIDPFEETILTKLDTEAYSKVGFKLTLDRHPVKHLLSYYFPSLIFVMVSWISFIIPPQVIPGRMTLLLTLLLVLMTMFGTIMWNQPPCKYPTSLDIWIIVCIVFVSAALFAYAAILMDQNLEEKTIVQPIDDRSVNEQTTFKKTWDKTCLKIFPVAFILFNVVYWPIIVARYQNQNK